MYLSSLGRGKNIWLPQNSTNRLIVTYISVWDAGAQNAMIFFLATVEHKNLLVRVCVDWNQRFFQNLTGAHKVRSHGLKGYHLNQIFFIYII